MKIDFAELEKQRRKEIIDSNCYLELDVLIASSGEESGKDMPVANMEMHNCGPQEISRLYVTLDALIEGLEREYPMECLHAKKYMKATAINVSNEDIENEQEDNE